MWTHLDFQLEISLEKSRESYAHTQSVIRFACRVCVTWCKLQLSWDEKKQKKNTLEHSFYLDFLRRRRQSWSDEWLISEKKPVDTWQLTGKVK